MKTLPVLFRMTTTADDFPQVYAVFPTMYETGGAFTCYAHVGQHGNCSREWYRRSTRPATPKEYAPLLRELRGIYENALAPGDEVFKLRVLSRWTRGCKTDEPYIERYPLYSGLPSPAKE